MRVASSVRRLAAAHWPLPAIGAIFLLTAAFVFDDYGVATDEPFQRAIGNAALDYLAGNGERAFAQLLIPHDRYYGAVFEAPLAIAERILGLDDTRDVYLGRHLLTHLFFLAGGVVCYLLAYRLFGSRPLALVAMVLFLLHPRIYAHSFFNSKDVPFLVAFMISLYLIHRAFRRDTLAAFLLCGVGVGLLVNLRIMGLVLFAAVLAMRALDLVTASGAVERRRILLTGGAFTLAAAFAYYASLPVLWTDPVGQFPELARVLRSHPAAAFNLFQGELLYSRGVPLRYVPVWVGITTPPAVLLLALAGAVALAWRALRRPRDIPRNGPLRFGLLLMALPVATIAGVSVLEGNVYDGWRQLYFLYAPLLLLAISGIHWLASSPRGRWMRTGTYALTGVAATVAIVSMVRIHPHQNSYFNFPTDRTTPERLASRYVVNYWSQSNWRVLDDIVGDHPSGNLHVKLRQKRTRQLLPPDDRKRLVDTEAFRSGERNFYELRNQPCPTPARAGTYVIHLYAGTLSCIVDPIDYFGALRRQALATEPLDRSRFGAYRVGDVMVYLRDGCSPDDLHLRFFLHVFPVDPAGALPIYHPVFDSHRKGYGFEMLNFHIGNYGVRINGDCVAVAPLPNYPIAFIRTGQYTPGHAESVWRAVGDSEPLVRSPFDIRFDPASHALIYSRGECSMDDTVARFAFHVYPDDADDIPPHLRGAGFDNLNFHFQEYGARTRDGRCIATIPLPRYPIASIHTGQYDETGRFWWQEFVLPDGR